MRYRPRVPQSFLEGVIFFLLMIPVAVFFLLKWIITGIARLIASARS